MAGRKKKINGVVRTLFKGARGGEYFIDRVTKGRNKGKTRRVYV